MPFPVSGKRGMRRPQMLPVTAQNTGTDKIPAPIAGINAVANIAEMGPNDAVTMINMVPAQYGVKFRTGYAEWCTNVGTGGVRTLIPFTGSIAVENRLFASAEDGIYEVSASTDSPTLLETFPVQDDESGRGVCFNVTTVGGRFAIYLDEANGYYYWDEDTDDWIKPVAGTAAGQVDGADPAEFVGGTLYKSRIWFVRKNTPYAYYLPAGLITGRVTEFNFGNKFRMGGNLVNLFNWTVDSSGVNSYLVAVSSGGDVLVYQGGDPDVPGNFRDRGSWAIGVPPAGRRIAGAFGGELNILSAYGLLPMSRLLSGSLVQQTDTYLSRRITPLINEEMRVSRASIGWEVKLLSEEGLILISTPKLTGLQSKQFVQSINSEGWALYHDIPYLTGEEWQSKFYIGTDDGRVLIHTGALDNVTLDDPDSSVEIEWHLLGAFRDYGDPGTFNQAHYIRPVFMAQQPPSYSVRARYDYDIVDIPATATPSVGFGALWDIALWDIALWGGQFEVIANLNGASGLGRSIAVELNGSSGAHGTLLRFDIATENGGFM